MGKMFKIKVLEVRPNLAEADSFCDSCGKITQELFKTAIVVEEITNVKMLCSTCLGAHAGLTLLADAMPEEVKPSRGKPNFKNGTKI